MTILLRWKRSHTVDYSPATLQVNKGNGWVDYTHPSVAAWRKPDYIVANGSPGYATMQNLLRCGAKYDNTVIVDYYE